MSFILILFYMQDASLGVRNNLGKNRCRCCLKAGTFCPRFINCLNSCFLAHVGLLSDRFPPRVRA